MNPTKHEMDPILKDFFDREVARAPKHHSLRGPSCPSMTRQAEAFSSGWAVTEWEHAAGCDYCCKMTVLQLENEHPKWPVLLQHLTLFGQQAPMQAHLETCWSCKLLMRSPIVNLVRFWIRTKLTTAQIGEKLANLVIGSVMPGERHLIPAVPQGKFANENQPPFYREFKGPNLEVYLREGERPNRPLIVRVDNPNGKLAGRTVECELIYGDGDPTRTSIKLKPNAELGATGQTTLGRYATLAASRDCWHILVYPADEACSPQP